MIALILYLSDKLPPIKLPISEPSIKEDIVKGFFQFESQIKLNCKRTKFQVLENSRKILNLLDRIRITVKLIRISVEKF